MIYIWKKIPLTKTTWDGRKRQSQFTWTIAYTKLINYT